MVVSIILQHLIVLTVSVLTPIFWCYMFVAAFT